MSLPFLLLVVPTLAQAADPFAWLEQVQSPRALTWVKAENAKTLARLTHDPHYQPFYTTALKLAQTPARIPLPETLGGMIYNFWQDETHVQGVWRRTTAEDYRTASPHWVTVLDLDALSRAEHHHWVWKGATCLEPEDKRCLIRLSEGGEDAVATREFDTTTNSFVAGGFDLPHSKMQAAWLDADTLLVATNWGPGSMTASGYPYIVKKLKRGQPLSAAMPYFQGKPDDVLVDLAGFTAGTGRHDVFIRRALDFFRSETYHAGATPEKLDLPQKVDLDGTIGSQLIVTLNEPAPNQGHPIAEGSLAALDLDHPTQPLTQIFTPGPRQSVQSAAYEADVATTKDRVVAIIDDNVRGRAMVFSQTGIAWQQSTLALPDNAALGLIDTNPRDNSIFVSVTGFLTPTNLYSADAAQPATPPTVVKSLPAQFDASTDVVEQHEATSTDGTKIPYFIVHPKTMQPTGTNPTLLYAYGGFQVSMLPTYNPELGKLWLEHGGVYVLANIRGGGEFGPAWHEAGLKTKRQIIYDDFRSVAENLFARHITNQAHLGIRGGSNGGLLMGVQFTQHPELYKAVIIDVPLLDMLGFEHIAAGASWVGEYGTVKDPVQRAFLAKISPYNNLHANVTYPEPFIFTTTRDDRVGPQHARKFAAKLASLHKPYFYYESIEGGHAAGANLPEKAKEEALEFTYLTEKLMN